MSSSRFVLGRVVCLFPTSEMCQLPSPNDYQMNGQLVQPAEGVRSDCWICCQTSLLNLNGVLFLMVPGHPWVSSFLGFSGTSHLAHQKLVIREPLCLPSKARSTQRSRSLESCMTRSRRVLWELPKDAASFFPTSFVPPEAQWCCLWEGVPLNINCQPHMALFL